MDALLWLIYLHQFFQRYCLDTKALLKAVFSLNNEQNKNIETLSGDIPSPLDLPKGCPFQNRCKYCKDICKQEKPKLKEISVNHRVACHLF